MKKVNYQQSPEWVEKFKTEFIEKAKKKFGNKFDYSKIEYIDSNTPVKIICPIHGEFEQSPRNHLESTYGCRQCSITYQGKDKFLRNAEKKFKDKFDFSQMEYIDSNTPVKIICPDHGEFWTKPTQLNSNKYGCPKCAREANSYSCEDMINKSKEIHGNKFDYSRVEYKNINTSVTIICPKHGEFKQTFNQHFKCKICCPKCVDEYNRENYKITYDEFIKRANDVHKNRYDYSKVDWSNVRNSSNKVKIICPKHGEFEQRIVIHLQGSGCPKCGANTMTQSEFIEKAKKIHKGNYDYSKVKYINKETPVTIICKKHNSEFNQLPYVHLQGSGCPICSHTASQAELQLIEFIRKHNIHAIHRDRTFIRPHEIDILIPEYKLAIEYSDYLWHSFGYNYPNNFSELDKNIHLRKTELIENKEFQLFHIFENEWLHPTKRKIWGSLIRNKLNLIPKKNVIYARKCEIVKISHNEAKDFLDENHIQGAGRVGAIRIGLLYQGDLISIMTFGKPSIAKSKAEYELIRFASRINHRVIGGASKLLSAFRKYYNPNSIVSYANRRWSQGKLYEKLGFKLIRVSEPNYFYFKYENPLRLYSRNHFQKHKLKERLEIFDPDLSEMENVMRNGYRVIYDAGNLVYLKEYK